MLPANFSQRLIRDWLGNVVADPVVQVEQVAEPKGVEAEFAGCLEEDVWVVPEGVGSAVLGEVDAVEDTEVSVEGDQVGLELGLEVEAEAIAVDLGIVVEVVLDFVVFDAGVGEGVEADG